MIYEGEDELICDFAETYGVFDYKALPLSTAATLAAGLSGDSRIKRKLLGLKVSIKELMLALIVDELNIANWQRSGGKGSLPKSLAEKLSSDQDEDELEVFDSPEDYEKWRKSLYE